MATIAFEEFKKEKGNAVVLDVRSKDEVAENGSIPGAKNLPFTDLDKALGLNEEDFTSSFGFPKPSPDKPIFTHCFMGGRAMKTVHALEEKGFTNVKCYSGSFKDWVKNGGEVVGKPQ